MIQTYFGYGKGKTTSAIGSAIRCTGCGNKVLFVQFLKNNDSSEINVLEKIDGIDTLHSEECYKLFDNLNTECKDRLSKAYTRLLFEDVRSMAQAYRMIVLDEILDATQFGYIDEDRLIEFLSELKNHTEFILTGHQLSEKISYVSDYISEITNIRHPYEKGVSPRKGIEF